MFLKLRYALFLFLILDTTLFFNSLAFGCFEERMDKIKSPLFRAVKGSQTVLLFGTFHELPLLYLENPVRIKEIFRECRILFVENDHLLPLRREEKKSSPSTRISQEEKRRIKIHMNLS